MSSIDAEANPKQTDITEYIARKRSLKKQQFTNHNQNYKCHYNFC